MLMSACNPIVSRRVSNVESCGLPSPRSMATTVLTATLAKSAKVCWLIPSFFLLFLIAIPISCCVIISLYCDFAAKVIILFYKSPRKSQYDAIFFHLWVNKTCMMQQIAICCDLLLSKCIAKAAARAATGGTRIFNFFVLLYFPICKEYIIIN